MKGFEIISAMTNTALSNFGKNLRKIRNEKGITLTRLASEIYVDRITLGLYEQGKRIPSLENAIILSNYFGVSIRELCGLSSVYEVQEIDGELHCPVCGSSLMKRSEDYEG